MLSACGERPAEATATRPVLTVELVSPVRASWPEMLTASGEVTPWQEASVGSELSGVRLDEVLVDVGDVVKKGQLLARYSEEILRAELAQLDAAVAEATANLDRAKVDVERADRLETANAMSQQAIQLYRTQARVAEAQLASVQARRDAQALKLRHARILAPDDGVISARNATVGAVGMTGTELFRMVRRNRLQWRAELPAEALRRLQPGTSAALQTPDGKQVTGTLRLLAPTVDAATRNGLAYVDLPADSGLVAGMYLTGRFTLPEREALVVPESAIALRDGNHYLMRVDEQSHVQEVKVATGRRRDDVIEVLGDIDAAQRFVKSGAAFVGDGDLVQVATPTAAAP